MITYFEENNDAAKAVREQIEHLALRVMTQLEMQHERGEISAADLYARIVDLERYFFPQLDIYEVDGRYGLCYTYAPSSRSSFTGADPEKYPITPAEYDEIRRADDCGFIDAQGRWTQNIDEAYVWSEGEDLMAIDL